MTAGWHRGTSCGKMLRLQQTRTPAEACGLRPRKRTFQPGRTPASECLQQVRNKCSREIPRQALKCRRVFFEKAAQFLRYLVLLAEGVRRVLIEHSSLPVLQRHAHAHDDQNARCPTNL